MNTNQINYWQKFYKNKKPPTNESDFANFCIKYFEEYNVKKVLDAGCGNCRDSKFFSNNDYQLISVDASFNLEVNHKNIQLLNQSFVNLDSSIINSIDVFYSRFSIHSISLKDENILLENLKNNLTSNKLLCIEVRSIKDVMAKEGTKIENEENAYITDHYRRFINYEVFLEKLKNHNFKILYSIESTGLAIYKDRDPCVIRIIAQKI